MSFRTLCRDLTAGLLVSALAIWVRIGWIPMGARHFYDGHEGLYLLVFQGSWPSRWNTQLVPFQCLLFRLWGHVTQEPKALLLLPLAASILGILALMALISRIGGDSPTGRGGGAALAAGVALALLGNHAFWSTSAYHVVIPFSLVLGGLALLVRPGRPWPWVAGLCMGLAIAMRLELATVLIPALLLTRTLRRTAIFLLATGLCAAPGLYMTHAAVSHLLEGALHYWATNLVLLPLLAPWSSAPALLTLLVATLLAARQHPRATLFFVTWALVHQIVASFFPDMGFRQSLPVVTCLCALTGLGVDAAFRSSRPERLVGLGIAVLSFALLARDTASVGRRYYAPADVAAAELNLAPNVSNDASFNGCTWVSEEPWWPTSISLDAATLEGNCILWGEEYIHRTWNSRELMARALRMHARYALEPMAVRTWPEDPGRPPRLVWRIEGMR